VTARVAPAAAAAEAAEPHAVAPRRVEVRGFPGWELRWADLRAAVVPALGGRIMSFRLARGSDRPDIELLWQAPDPASLKLHDLPAAHDLPALRRATGPRHFGGHKTWLAPRSRWGDGGWPFLDLEIGTYAVRLEAAAVEVTSPTCRETGMIFTRRLAFEGGGLRVSERMTNGGTALARFALWSVTQLAGRGRARFPLGGDPAIDLAPTEDGLPNEGLRVLDDVVELDCQHRRAARIGTAHAGGWVEADVVVDGGEVVCLRKSYEGLTSAGELPHGCVVEVYDFAPGRLDAFELELLTPVVALAPGATIGFTETWTATRAAEVFG
jgi:hypothetical protein